MDAPESPFAAASPAGRLWALSRGMRVIRHRVKHGATVFRQGDPAHALFLLETGRVRMTRALEDGTSVTLLVAEAGEAFAEASLSAARYHCDAVAEVDSVIHALPKAGLLAALAAHPEESLALVLSLATQVRDLRARLELRNIRSAAARLLAWLSLHASGTPPAVRTERSWTLIATELGLTREAVYRALATLEREGRIRRDKHEVLLAPRAAGERTHRA